MAFNDLEASVSELLSVGQGYSEQSQEWGTVTGNVPPCLLGTHLAPQLQDSGLAH